MNWAKFQESAPEMAKIGEVSFERYGVVLVGTVRRDGSPRISPVEPLFLDGHLYLGMMWRSLKALDLIRDPRCSILNAISSRDGGDGEFRIYGRTLEVHDLEERRRYCEGLHEKIGWSPTEPEFHVFRVEIGTAAFTHYPEGSQIVQRWTPDRGTEIIKEWKP